MLFFKLAFKLKVSTWYHISPRGIFKLSPEVSQDNNANEQKKSKNIECKDI